MVRFGEPASYARRSAPHTSLSEGRQPWILKLPGRHFSEKTVNLSMRQALGFVGAIRGATPGGARPDWTKSQYSTLGEDLVGGWLLKNGGETVGLQKGRKVRIPEGGTLPRRRADWILGKRIIIEATAYAKLVSKGGNLKVDRQFKD